MIAIPVYMSVDEQSYTFSAVITRTSQVAPGLHGVQPTRGPTKTGRAAKLLNICCSGSISKMISVQGSTDARVA